MTTDPIDRRQVMRTAAVAGVAVTAGLGLAACGSSTPSGAASAPATTPPASGSPASSQSAAPSTSAANADGANANGLVLGKSSEIPVGGGTVFGNVNVVVTQPTAGTFKGFSSTCTHLGCHVNKIENGLIECPCHGSRYSVTDGSVKAGPAPSPLPAANVSVQNGEVILLNS